MLHVDIPTRADLLALAEARHDASVTLVLPTTPVTREAQADRTAFGNLAGEALRQLEAAGTEKRTLWPLAEHLDDLAEDDEFWAHQARSLVVLATPDSLRSFRLPNHLTESVEVSDRFNLVPLVRAVTFAQQAVLLVLSEQAAQTYTIGPEGGATPLAVAGMPSDAASVAHKASIAGRSPKRRLHGSEGKKVHLRAYVRRVDEALRPVLQGREIPLALIATEPLASIFASVCSHAPLLTNMPAGLDQHASAAELSGAARTMLDGHYRTLVEAFGARFAALSDARRATVKVTDAAFAATFGFVDTLAVDMDQVLPGWISEEGHVEYADAPGPESYNLLGEIATRALATGARVVAGRTADLPEGAPLAALLRRPV